MTLTEMLAAVQANHGRTDRDAVARNGIAFALQEFSKTYEHRGLRAEIEITLPADTNSVDLPEGLLNLYEVRLINETASYDLPIKNFQEVLRDYPDVTTWPSSLPRAVYQTGTSLKIVPMASADYVLRITYSTMSVLATDDASMAVSGLDFALVAYGTAYVFESIQMFQQAQYWLSRAGQAFASFIEADKRDPGWDRVIRPGVNHHPDQRSAPFIAEDPFAGLGDIHGT